MSEEICKYHYTFSCTHNIATIYEDDMIICKDILIEEKTLDRIIDKLNALAEENEMLKKEQDCLESSLQFFAKQCKKLQEENERLKKDLECCEYKHFLTEQKKQREKVERGDLSDFTEWKYLQCKYYKRDYDKHRDICTRIASNSLLNSCLHNKCTKMVLKSVMEMKELEETNLTLVKEIRKLPLTDKQFKEMNDRL